MGELDQIARRKLGRYRLALRAGTIVVGDQHRYWLDHFFPTGTRSFSQVAGFFLLAVAFEMNSPGRELRYTVFLEPLWAIYSPLAAISKWREPKTGYDVS
jgi:hypothetical protein